MQQRLTLWDWLGFYHQDKPKTKTWLPDFPEVQVSHRSIMSYSEKVLDAVSDLSVSFKRQREIIYNTAPTIQEIIEYVFVTFANYDTEKDIDDTHETSRRWFQSLSEQDQLKVISLFRQVMCLHYIELQEDEEEEDELDLDDFVYQEEVDFQQEVNQSMKNLDEKDQLFLYKSTNDFMKARETKKETEIKQIVVPFSTVEKELNDLKEENARLKTIIDAMKMAMKL